VFPMILEFKTIFDYYYYSKLVHDDRRNIAVGKLQEFGSEMSLCLSEKGAIYHLRLASLYSWVWLGFWVEYATPVSTKIDCPSRDMICLP
jgi:hypothetical protein